HGLAQAWDLGARKVILELDSLVVVQSINGPALCNARHMRQSYKTLTCFDLEADRLSCGTVIERQTRLPISLPILAIVIPSGFIFSLLCLLLFRVLVFSDCIGVFTSHLIQISS
ncbi:hypothetical protein LINPERHAP2_LOCUS22149, partial [Linum perenne]